VRRTLALAALALVAATAAGCGGSDESEEDPTAAWASSFCSAVTTWTDELQNITSQFSNTSNFSEDALRSAADDAKSATDQLAEDLRDLGTPDTPSGEAVRSEVDDLSTAIEDESTKIEDAADGVSSLADLPGAISAITSSVTAMSTALTDTLTAIDDADAGGELKTALEESPECDEISN
jgi:methyl-accepting chemotaxis protein